MRRYCYSTFERPELIRLRNCSFVYLSLIAADFFALAVVRCVELLGAWRFQSLSVSKHLLLAGKTEGQTLLAVSTAYVDEVRTHTQDVS